MLVVKKFGGTSVANKERIFNVAKPKPAILFNNRMVSFYYIPSVGLIEFLLEENI